MYSGGDGGAEEINLQFLSFHAPETLPGNPKRYLLEH
jgi:hypothetical protein